MTMEFIASFLFAIIRVSTPLLFGAMAAVVTRKAGLLNLAIESMMLASALAGVLCNGLSGSLLVGILGGCAAAVLITLIVSYSAFVLKSDLYLVSIAMNTALVGGTVFVMYIVTGQKANTASFVNVKPFGTVNIPLLKDIPFLGQVLSGHNIMTYVAIFCVFMMWFFIYKTKIGLRIRSVGENPQAAESVGISPTRIYFLAFILSGVMASLGGMYMSMGYLRWFARDMMAGRGLISMSAMNIANGDPLGSALAAMMFGAADALSNYMQLTSTPSELVSMFPFVSTVVLLVIISFIRIVKHRYETMAK
jgi:simple sugar transport system permease protein